ncbi:MAG: GntR family transcriptional regulator [Actinobacteria bacterium]|nr:GntR family transcriptional regulator [Actinomycetota bacterium]
MSSLSARQMFPRPPSRPYPGTRADAARWVRDTIRSQIMEGAFGGLAAPMPPLPPETQLAEELGVSRNAVREALDLLRAEGLITRTPGAGTFVTGAKLRQGLDRLEGLAESLAGHHLPVENRVLSVREAPATPFVARKLAVEEGSPVAFVERLRLVGGIPLSLDTSSLRAEALPVLLGADLTQDDVFLLLEEKAGLRLGWAEVTTEAVSADEATAKLLATRTGSPLLLLHRLTYLDDGTPFDLEAIRYRGDRCSLVTTIPRSVPGG